MSDSYSDDSSDDERYFFQMKSQKYLKAVGNFNRDVASFEAKIPSMADLSYKERAVYVLEHYEPHLFGLHDRPKGLKMGVVLGNIDELKLICKALTVGWRLWPDWWTGLLMMLDYLADDTQTADIKKLDPDFLQVLKEIGKNEDWPNNKICGPEMASQAKQILIKYNRPAGDNDELFQPKLDLNVMANLTRVSMGLPLALPVYEHNEHKICDGVGCLEVETEIVKFKHCAKCKKAFYHVKECQVKAWGAGHKKVCTS